MRTTFLISLLLAGIASADTRWGLRWKAPDECISASELSELVEKKLGRSVFGASPEYRVEGTMTGQAASPKWRARVTVVSAQGDVLGSREVVGDGDCRSLDERVAFIVSISIDESVTEAPKPEVKAEPPPEAPVSIAAKVLPSPLPDTVWVEIESDTPNISLMRVSSRGFGSAGNNTVYMTTWEKACVSPCEQLVDRPSSDFFLAAPGMTGTAAFSLKSYQGVKLKVKAGSLGARFAGVMLTTMSAGVVLVGGLFALIGTLGSNPQPGVQNPYGGIGSTFQTIGFGMLAGGGAALAAGIPLIAFSGTKVEFLPLRMNGLQGRDSSVTEL